MADYYAGFTGKGFIESHVGGFWLRLNHGRLLRGNTLQFKTGREPFPYRLVQVLSNGFDLRPFVGRHVLVTGYFNTKERYVIAEYISVIPVPIVTPSTSSMVDGSMQHSRSTKEHTVDTVTMSRQEFENAKHQEFKDGLKYGLKLTVERMKRWASVRFLAKDDVAATVFRDAAQSFEDDKKSLPFRDYSVRPYLGDTEGE